jgi:hypothetical protein
MNTTLALTIINGDSHTYKEAILSPHKTKWEAVIKDKYNSIVHNEMFSPAQAPFGKKSIRSKQVFQTKRDSEG